MNTKLIQQYGEDILCYRLRSERHKKRAQHEDFDKRLIVLYKEERFIYRKQQELGWEHLIPPVQKGWKRFFVLREDVAKSKQAEFFQEILKKINTYDWSHRKDFKIKRRKKGRKIYVVKMQKLQEPWQCHFEKLGFNEYQKQFFHEVVDEYRQRFYSKKYVFNEPWRFVLTVKPNIITKVRRRIDPAIESRLHWICDYLERNDLRKRQTVLLHGHYQWYGWSEFEKYDEADPLKNKPIKRILDDIKVL